MVAARGREGARQGEREGRVWREQSVIGQWERTVTGRRATAATKCGQVTVSHSLDRVRALHRPASTGWGRDGIVKK